MDPDHPLAMSLASADKHKVYLVTGGHGFIGSHVARCLFKVQGIWIRIVDTVSLPSTELPICHEFLRGDLRDPNFCRVAVRNVHSVLHFAANMGGMGVIHARNDFVLYKDNHNMTVNLLQAALGEKVERFLYASSACVYPESLQSDADADISLRETQTWQDGQPPSPQGLYGLEKLNTELILHQHAVGSTTEIRIARFHNVYGPGGAWNNGREKAPAAMSRKALVLQRLGSTRGEFEIWGDGTQRRSFLFIDDAVDAVVKLLDSSCTTPLNIGSDSAVTIRGLADIALRHTGIHPPDVSFVYKDSAQSELLRGVASRNSNNDLVQTTLNWRPTTSLDDGMRRTMTWIQEQITNTIKDAGQEQETILCEMLTSKEVDLQSKRIIFGILLPITSFGSDQRADCLIHLRRFAKSLLSTTRADTMLGSEGVSFHFVIYLAVDEVDEFLLPKSDSRSRAEEVLRAEGIFDIVVILCDHPRGHVCKHWKDCARRAWNDQCDYMVLLGDDVVLEDEGWMRNAHSEFTRLASERNVPNGFGCVAFADISFPGMPTFPIISRTHMDIFQGAVIPDIFINQDGDPFLFQLYRRWGCSTMFSSRISNGIGGEAEARYAKRSAQDWTFETLTNAVLVTQTWLKELKFSNEEQLTLDVVIPCYRVDLNILDTILSLKPSNTCAVTFIIIIDDPTSQYIRTLQDKYSQRPDIRIRVNKTNYGASASRNRGMKESAADWVHFLDDDVVPEDDLLLRDEEVIRAHPNAAGFVGTTLFPCADTIFTTAVHLAGVTYFWDIAKKIEDDVPWGVTANLIARRNIKDGVEFNLIYPKTGGGEDIHFCREKRDASLARGGEGFYAAPDVKVVHPWWNGGNRSYWRFYKWSVGDGALIKEFPEHSYRDFAPNSAESLFLCILGIGTAAALGQRWLFVRSVTALASVVLANVLHDCYRHLYRNPDRNEPLNSSLKGTMYSPRWVLAIIESCFIRMFSECGRLRGQFLRGEYISMGKRFEWFAGRWGGGPRAEERKNNVQRLVLSVVILKFAIWLIIS